MQRRIQNPVEHLRWSVLRKQLTAFNFILILAFYLQEKKYIWKTFRHLSVSIPFFAILFALLHSELYNNLQLMVLQRLCKRLSCLQNIELPPFQNLFICFQGTKFQEENNWENSGIFVETFWNKLSLLPRISYVYYV